MNHKPLPIGTDDFKKLISEGYYYIDKTLFIKELLDKKGGKPVHPSPAFWENPEHEYAPLLFRGYGK